MLKYYIKGFSLLLWVLLVSCDERAALAPVEEVNWKVANNRESRHVVMSGETLFAIAFRYDQDYRQLAQLNHLHSPYTLRVGQVIYLNRSMPPVASPRAQPVRNSAPHYPTHYVPYTPHTPPVVRSTPHPQTPQGRWIWPAQGRVVANFAPLQARKGIDIAGKQGSKIVAASSGVVAYAGSGLPGYGNLIIIKHNDNYLTAYGNNSRNLVREGQRIKAGQTIAEMGMIERRFWGVHFEIRKSGQPVNPLNYLPRG
jgi:lipoprotein NlpD